MRLSLAALVPLLAVLGVQPATADDVAVDLELVLAVDVSMSMDYEEQALQREGYVAAFQHPDVIQAIQSGLLGRIAVTYVEWAGAGLQRVVVPWTLIDGAESGRAFAARMAAAPLSRLRRTSISGALLFSGGLFSGNGFEGTRQVIDISGDGPHNAGVPSTAARDEVIGKGIVINGLPIMLKINQPGGFFSIKELDLYYEDCVIGGPGAFFLTVNAATEFAVAIRRKMILEIAGRTPDAPRFVPVQYVPPGPPIDCLIGEKMWQQWFQNME